MNRTSKCRAGNIALARIVLALFALAQFTQACGAASTAPQMPESELTTMAAGRARSWLNTVQLCDERHQDWFEAEVLSSAPCTRSRCDYQCCNWCDGQILVRLTTPGSAQRDIQTQLLSELGTRQLDCELTAVNRVIRNTHYRVNGQSWTDNTPLNTQDLCRTSQ